MKEVTKEKVQKYTVYKALDGTEFDDKAECEKYEKSAKGVLMARIAKLIVGKGNAWTIMGGYEDHDIVGFKMLNAIDLEALKQFLLLECPWYNREDNTEDKEKIFDIMEKAYDNDDIILFGINCDGDYYWINSRQNIIDNLTNLGKTSDSQDEKA